jgi:hypothetical protein
MDSKVDWDELVNALRDELQEKGGLIRLLNQQTEMLYRRDNAENQRLEEQIRAQLLLVARCTRDRELALRQTAAKLDLIDDVQPSEVIRSFPEYVHPLLEALFSEVDRLSNRMSERLKQNQGLKQRFICEASPAGS